MRPGQGPCHLSLRVGFQGTARDCSHLGHSTFGFRRSYRRPGQVPPSLAGRTEELANRSSMMCWLTSPAEPGREPPRHLWRWELEPLDLSRTPGHSYLRLDRVDRREALPTGPRDHARPASSFIRLTRRTRRRFLMTTPSIPAHAGSTTSSYRRSPSAIGQPIRSANGSTATSKRWTPSSASPPPPYPHRVSTCFAHPHPRRLAPADIAENRAPSGPGSQAPPDEVGRFVAGVPRSRPTAVRARRGRACCAAGSLMR